ncbi:hypothetical protein HDU93_008981 [Gonapodya sp. JEL0774]|nr:hypothetical protein HDU93_008981 [Gonapodya sp. JEL0774]
MISNLRLTTFASPLLESAHFWLVVISGLLTIPVKVAISRAVFGAFLPGATFFQEFVSKTLQQLRWSIPEKLIGDGFTKEPGNAVLYAKETLTIGEREVVLHTVGDKSVALKDVERQLTTFPSKVLVFYVHGGGFNIAHTTGYLPFFKHLYTASVAPHGPLKSIKFVGIDYTLSPEVQFPVARDQIVHVYKEILLGKEGVDPKKIVLANLSYDVFTYEVLDLVAKNYVGPSSTPEAILCDPEVSPVYAKPSDFAGGDWPPTQVSYGENEVLADDGKFLAATLRRVGVDVEEVVGKGKVHIYQIHQVEDKEITSKFVDWFAKVPARK